MFNGYDAVFHFQYFGSFLSVAVMWLYAISSRQVVVKTWDSILGLWAVAENDMNRKLGKV
jgi:hypothetical protein